MIQTKILELTDYALQRGLIQPEDQVYTVNRLLELFGLDEPAADGMDVQPGVIWKNVRRIRGRIWKTF